MATGVKGSLRPAQLKLAITSRVVVGRSLEHVISIPHDDAASLPALVVKASGMAVPFSAQASLRYSAAVFVFDEQTT